MPFIANWIVLLSLAFPAIFATCHTGESSAGLTPDGAREPKAGAVSTPTGSPETDKEALLAFYDATNIFDWLTGGTWHVNDPLELWPGVSTDEDGRVTLLSLTGLGALGEGLKGELPAELGDLSSLRTLRLDQHLLSGGIPAELGRLSNLEVLSIRDSGISGSIPQELGNLTNLRRLAISYNKLSGELPPELGNLSNLQLMDLSYNQLTGPIPSEFGNLSNLETLFLQWNQLSDEIPPELWNLTNVSLHLSPNQGSWCVPADQLDRWGPNGSVDLAECGSLGLATATPAPTRGPRSTATATPYPTLTPDAIMDREALVALYNATGGDNWHRKQNWLTDKPLSLWEGVETDVEIGTDNEGRVVFLSLRDNNLSGVIPAELGRLASLELLDLFWNNLSGEIPAELGDLVNLSYLDLSRNQLSGEIPPELGNLSSLGLLYLHENNLSGDIPHELGSLSNLKQLRIDGAWTLSGCVPAALQTQLDMERSDLQDVPFC